MDTGVVWAVVVVNVWDAIEAVCVVSVEVSVCDVVEGVVWVVLSFQWWRMLLWWWR